MKHKITLHQIGQIEYKNAWDYQQQLFDGLLNAKQANENHEAGHLIICEHPHVFTLGKSGSVNNLLVNPDFLEEIHATYYKTNRGGDITYHGPGQIVGYPIVDLEVLGMGIKDYINALEEVIVRCIFRFNIQGQRLDGASGVWVDANTPQARKICAIGVRASRYVTMHGFALNVNTNLEYFSYINPCGFVDKGVTSIQKELKRKVDIDAVIQVLNAEFSNVFDCSLLERKVNEGIPQVGL